MKLCPGCGQVEIEPRRFTCWKCWETVPEGLRAVIWLLKKGEAGPGERSGKPYPGLDEAIANAIEQAREAFSDRVDGQGRDRRNPAGDRAAGD